MSHSELALPSFPATVELRDAVCLQQQRRLGNVGLCLTFCDHLTLCSLRFGWLLRKLKCCPKIKVKPPGRRLMTVEGADIHQDNCLMFSLT